MHYHVIALNFPHKQKKHNEHNIHCLNTSVRTIRTDVFNYTKIIFFVNGITTKQSNHFLVIFHKKILQEDFYSYLQESYFYFFSSTRPASSISFFILLSTAKVAGKINIPQNPITFRPTYKEIIVAKG